MHLYSASHKMIVLTCLALLLCAFTSGVISHDRKHTNCCKATKKLPDPSIQIKSCKRLPAKDDCVEAVAFTDTSGKMHCINPNAPQLPKRINILKEKGVICKDPPKS